MRRGWQQQGSKLILRHVVVVRVEVGEGSMFRTPPALCRLVLQLLPNGKGENSSGHHRLYAVWYFNFCLTEKGRTLPDTTGFMPCGTSISAFSGERSKLFRVILRLKLKDHAA